MQRQRVHADVAVIGGGPAGAAMALALADAGLSITVVRRADAQGWKIGESLPPVANAHLRRLGIWEQFLADGHLPSYGNASAWGMSQLADQSFLFSPYGHGWHLDRERFDALLLQAAIERGAELVTCTRVSQISRTGRGWKLDIIRDTDASASVDASFVVDATGRSSWFGRQQGAARRKHDDLVGLVGLFATSSPGVDRDHRTIVEAAEDGWWYATTIPRGGLVVALMTDADIVAQQALHGLSIWFEQLADTYSTGVRIVNYGYRLVQPPRAASANSSRLHPVTGDQWLATGDAAAAYDPLSARGITSALHLAWIGADAIRSWLGGKRGALATYAEIVDTLYGDYLESLAAYYAVERRWTHRPFWARRGRLGGERRPGM